MKDIDKYLEINIVAIIEAGYIKSKEDMTEEELEQLRKVIEHAECYNYGNCR